MKYSAKDDLRRSLRSVLVERKVVTRKDKSEDVITLSNSNLVVNLTKVKKHRGTSAHEL